MFLQTIKMLKIILTTLVYIITRALKTQQTPGILEQNSLNSGQNNPQKNQQQTRIQESQQLMNNNFSKNLQQLIKEISTQINDKLHLKQNLNTTHLTIHKTYNSTKTTILGIPGIILLSCIIFCCLSIIPPHITEILETIQHTITITITT